MKWEEEVAGLCSCLYFIFSKVCTEELFQEKVLTCPGNRLFVNKDQWAFPFSFPVLLPFSCHFCPHIYLLLSYPFQHLFSALSCSAALSAFTYTQLHHPTHSLQNSSYEKSLCLILCSTGLRWEVYPLQWRTPTPITPPHTIPLPKSPPKPHVAQFRLQSHLVFCFKHNQHCKITQVSSDAHTLPLLFGQPTSKALRG